MPLIPTALTMVHENSAPILPQQQQGRARFTSKAISALVEELCPLAIADCIAST